MKLFDGIRSCLNGRTITLFVLFFALTVALQKMGGAYHSEFGGHPDEAAHYVTGLMVRDYIAAGFPGSPMTYAKKYYDHYPKVALGNWPPVFYLVQSAWTLPFSPQRVSVLLLMGFLTAVLATLLFSALMKAFGFGGALAGGLLLIALPLTQRHTAMVMTEIPVAVFSFAALIFFARFLETSKTSDSIGFGLCAALTILTKGSGLFLGLVPPLAILLARKFSLLKRPALWYSAIIVFVLCFPWTWKFRDVARAGWMEGNPSLHFTKQAIEYYPKKLLLSVGFGLGLWTVVGFLAGLRRGFKQVSGSECSIVFATALFSLLVFHAVVPCGLEDRHLVPVLPVVIFFSIVGVNSICAFINARKKNSRVSPVHLLGLAVLAFVIQAFFTAQGEPWQRRLVPEKGFEGFSPVAQSLLKKVKRDSGFLVSSDSRGEGMFISEVAMREKRPGHVVQRASKALSSSNWSGGAYKPRFETEEALTDFLKQSSIEYLVVDTSVPTVWRRAHHEMLQHVAEKNSEMFLREGEFPIIRDNVRTNGIFVYRIKRS